MKHNFKKILAAMLAVFMLASMAAAAIPAGAEDDEAITLAPNEDNWVNGVKIRFETAGTDTYAKIEDGKLHLKMRGGDLLWFPELTVKDASTVISFDLIALSGDATPRIVTGIDGYATDKKMYAQGFAGYGKWACSRLSWLANGNLILGDAAYDTWYTPDGGAGSTTFTGNAILDVGETMTTTTTFTMGTSALRPVTTFQEGNVADPYVHTYADDANININGSFGIAMRKEGPTEICIDKITATNLNGVDSYVEDFETIDSYEGPIVNMRNAGTLVDFDGELAFIEFSFVPHKTVGADVKFYALKNGELHEELTIGDFTPDENGVCKYTTYFTSVQYTDELTFCLVNDDGEILDKSTHTLAYGADYQTYVENPVITSADLIYEKYAEDFSTAITLQPGENIVNGKKWTYIKNSTNGYAVIKDGRLYFTGSNYDMILFDDLDVDQTAYCFSYDLTYLKTPADDIWTDWTSWFGGLHYLTDADLGGNRSGYVTSVTPNDVYMLMGTFDADGVFTVDEDYNGHVNFPNSNSNPTQPGEQYYWNGRLGNGTPTSVRSYFGVKGNAYGGLGMSAYSVTGAHQVSANLPGYANIPPMERRAGTLGFVCSESEVNVIVDNLSIKIKGKNIVVDDETVQIASDGKLDIADLERDGERLIYTNFDGVVKYAGETVVATRLSLINTVQITLKTNKLAADGETGLKWTTEISKADYEMLLADENIEKVEFGTVVVPTAVAKSGVDKLNAGLVADMAGEAAENGNKYVFSGTMAVNKANRDTSYSGVGYILVTMKDGTQIVAYADYIARNHAYALSDLVESFSDADEDNNNSNNNNSNNNNNNSNNPIKDSEVTTEIVTDTAETNEDAAKSGCFGTVSGIGALVTLITLGGACMVNTRKKEND